MKRGPERDDLLSYLFDAGKRSIESYEQYTPTLVVQVADGMQVLVLAGDAHPFERLVAVLPIVIDMHPSMLSFSADTFYLIVETEAEAEAIRGRYNNSLERAWNAGEPSVSEALVINVVTADDVEVHILPYTRTDDGIVWKDPVPEREGYSGRIVEVMKLVFDALRFES